MRRTRLRPLQAAFVLLLVCAPFAMAEAERPAGVGTLAGAHTRLVWVQDLGKGGDTFAKGKKLRLMGYDSKDGKGARAILEGPGSFSKPLLTADGKRVVYSDRHAGKVYVVNFDGSGRKELADGYAADVWRDPDTGHDWVYVQDPGGKRKPIRRFRLDRPGKRELVWDRTPATLDNFQLSADGTRAGGLFPWSNAGVAKLPNGGWKRLGRGCWTSLSPDNSYLFWVFDGPHRNVYVTDTVNGRKWKVDIHKAPGIDGFEVYHPRWTNHVRYIVMTGPYKVGGGRNRIGGGGKAVEVYLGRFSPDLQRIEKWARVTDNKRGDFFPDAWIAGGEKVSAAEMLAKAREELLAEIGRPDAKELAGYEEWPGGKRALQFLWENADATNMLPAEKEGEWGKTCEVRARGHARVGRFNQMLLTDGAFLAQDADERLLAACKRSNQLAVEAVITIADLKQSGPARIVTFSRDTGARNFTLGQDGDKLVFRLRTPRTGGNGTDPQVTLCAVKPGRTYHVIVSYAKGQMYCFVDGEQVLATGEVGGDFGNWEPMHLLFGDEWSADRDWKGWLEGVAIYSRFVGPEEAARKWSLYSERLEERGPARRSAVKAKLVEATPVPPVEDLEDYSRAMVVCTYEVRKVISGAEVPERINVAHWVYLDRKPLPSARGRKPGKICELAVEPAADHPELEPERRFEAIEDPTLPLYLDVGIP